MLYLNRADCALLRACTLVIVVSTWNLGTRAQITCDSDVAGSYGDLRETITNGEFAWLVGVACGGTCYEKASRWSDMALRHGDSPVANAGTCRGLCRNTLGCSVWTYDSNAGECRAMRSLSKSPALAPGVPNTTTGKPYCHNNSSAYRFLPFPDSLEAFTPLDIDEPCFRLGYLYGDGSRNDVECSHPPPRAPLLEVHAPQEILDRGVEQGWWDDFLYAEDSKNATQAKLVATPHGKPYQTAKKCSQACTGKCGGFSFTHGICLLRGHVYQPEHMRNLSYSVNTSCSAEDPAVRLDAIAGPSWNQVSSAGTCTRQRRTVPQPYKEWFERCDIHRCTKPEDVGPGGEWLRWDLTAPFEQGTRNFAFKARPGGGDSEGTCYFPVYNRTEIRALLGGEGSDPGLETWVIVLGGSNSYGMGGAVMKAVHNTGADDGGGSGISEGDSQEMNIWRKNCIVDTIRLADGTSIIRKLPYSACTVGALHGNDLSDTTASNLRNWLGEADDSFKPGSIRVTHMGVYFFSAVTDLLDKVLSAYLKSGPWKRLLLWSHSIQRSGTDRMVTDLKRLAESEVCDRNSVLCVIGTKYTRNQAMIDEQRKFTHPASSIHLLDTAYMALNGFEWYGSHGLQSLHLEMFMILLNSWDLYYSLSNSQKDKEVNAWGCPEALRLPKLCNSAGTQDWNGGTAFLCDFERDEITPLYGLPVYQRARIPDGQQSETGFQGHSNDDGPSAASGAYSGACGGSMAALDLYAAIQLAGNRSVAAQKQISDKVDSEVDGRLSSRPPLCKGRLWCGYEYHAWTLGMSAAFAVAAWWATKMCLFELQRDQETEDARLKKKSEKLAKVQARKVDKSLLKSPSKRHRRLSLDPGNGGRRESYASGHTQRKSKAKKQYKGRSRSIISKNGSKKRRGSVVKLSTKPLSTATGERLTSLGPARFMASMHIVAGHLYQKSAIGPMYLLSWGYTWVPWFFMLSGYVLMHARLNSRSPDRVDHPLTALWKRTSSIFPMYAIGVLLDMACYWVRGSELPDYYILVAQSFLLQSWVPYFTEKSLQVHCWFLSAMVIYWLCFGPAYRFIRKLSLVQVLAFMTFLGALPWLAVIIPSEMGDLAFYKGHRTGSLAEDLDHIVVTLKFNPVCYAHVFLFGMSLARFRRHVTRRQDSFETQNTSRPCTQFWLLVPFRVGATLGYASILATFLILKEASAAKAKISARLGILMPLQGLILLGLSPLRGLQRDEVEVRWWWQQTGSDPIANLFRLVPGRIGDVSYAQYILQMLAYTVWPVRLDVFGRFGWIPFFAFLQSISFLCAVTVHTPARKAWVSAKARRGRRMLIWPILLACVLCGSKFIQKYPNSSSTTPKASTNSLSHPYIRMGPEDFWEAKDSSCGIGLYSRLRGTSFSNSSGDSMGAFGNYSGEMIAALDVELNWTTSVNGSVINPSILFIDSSLGLDTGTYSVIRAARVHWMEETSQKIDLHDSPYHNGSITEVNHTWHSTIVAAEDTAVTCDFNSWDPEMWGLQGKKKLMIGLDTMHPVSIVSSKATGSTWNSRLCRPAPTWIPENKTLVYKIVTGAEDPKVFSLPSWINPPSSRSQEWAMLFSSLPPVNLIPGGASGCDGTSKASVQMYVSMGVPQLFSGGNSEDRAFRGQPKSSLPAGVLLMCGRRNRDEKNWIPFNVGLASHFVYSISPHVVLTARPTDGECIKAYSTSAFSPLNDLASKVGEGKIRGSATAERFGPDRFLALMHTKLEIGRGYTTMAYMFSDKPPFEIIAVSRPIPLSGYGKAFASGLKVLNNGSRILISYGVADKQSRAMMMTLQTLRDLFVWNSCSEFDKEWWDVAFPDGSIHKSSDGDKSAKNASSACDDAIKDVMSEAAKAAAPIDENDEPAPQTKRCVHCEGAKYCPSQTTEVFFTCEKGYTPERVGLSNITLNLSLCFNGVLILCGLVWAVRKWVDRKLESEFLVDPSLRDPEHLSKLKASKVKKSAKLKDNNESKVKDLEHSLAPLPSGVKTKGLDLVWFYCQSPDGGDSPVGPYYKDEIRDALLSGSLFSVTMLYGTDANGNDPKGEGWMQVQEVAGMPPSEAPEWYSLGDDGIVEGPYTWSVIKGWYMSGAVASDLLMNNGGQADGNASEWRELHIIMDDAEAEAAATEARKEKEALKEISDSQLDNDIGSSKVDSGGETKPKSTKAQPFGLSVFRKNGGSRTKIQTREDRLQVMWYIVDDASGEYVGPYPGSMLYSWVYWGDISHQTMVAQVLDVATEETPGTIKEETLTEAAKAFLENRREEKNNVRDTSRCQSGIMLCLCACLQKSESRKQMKKVNSSKSANGMDVNPACVAIELKQSTHPPRENDGKNWNEESEWIERVDPGSGRYYYFHEKSGQTSWEEPTLQKHGGFRPSEWRIHYDGGTGRWYYSNRVTGESTWELKGSKTGTSTPNVENPLLTNHA